MDSAYATCIIYIDEQVLLTYFSDACFGLGLGDDGGLLATGGFLFVAEGGGLDADTLEGGEHALGNGVAIETAMARQQKHFLFV